MDFDELLQEAEKLSNVAGRGNDNLQDQQSVSEVLQKTHELHTRATRNCPKGIEANLLLNPKGIDLSRTTQKLEDLNIPQTLEPCIKVEDFIKNEIEKAKHPVIDKHNRISKMDNVKVKWAEEKTILLSSLVGPSQEFIDLGSVSKQTVLDHKSVQRSQLNHIEKSYAQALIECNETLVQSGNRPKLVQKFTKIVECFYDDKLIEMWSILLNMVSLPSSSLNIDPMKRYQEPEEFITHAKSFLESHFKLYMSSVVMDNVALDKYYGTPNIYNLIKGFVWVNFQGNNMIGLVDIKDGSPLWPHVYYALRSGEMEIAVEFLKAFDYENSDFLQVIQDKIKHPFQEVNSRYWAQLYLLYSTKLKKTTDAFKKASFCLIVGFDLHESHSTIIKTIEDFLWLRLYLLHTKRIFNDCVIMQDTFPGLQSLILEKYGESYFHAYEQPQTYFRTLVLTGQFEAAIEFLMRLEDYRSHAVHMALALNQLCALNTPRDVQSPILTVDDDDPLPMKRLNFARLIITYTKSFECCARVTEALHYYSFLRKYKYCDGRNVFVTCVCDLALKTLSFDLIFGKFDPAGNGQIKVGLFDQFSNVDCKTYSVAVMVAEQLVVRNMLENAVYLFDLCGLHDKAVKILNGLISQCVKDFPHPGTLRHRLTKNVNVYKERLEAHQLIIEPQTITTFVVLYNFLKFFNYYHKKKHENALKCLANTNLIPNEISDTEICIENINLLSDESYNVVPSILVTVMDIYYEAYKKNKHKIGKIKDIEIQFVPILIELRNKAKALNFLAITIPYKMPKKITERLLQKANSMN